MASNFAFTAYGLSQSMTVGTVTISLVVQAVGATATTTLVGGNYVPKSVRISNDGTVPVFINFGTSAGTVSVSTSNGMKVRASTDVVVGTGGAPFLAAIAAGTTTIVVTPGEGIS